MAGEPAASGGEVLEIRPPRRWPGFGLRELWVRRDLVYILTWRVLRSRYKQAFLGVTWAIIQPLVLMLIFTVVLVHLAGPSASGVAYPLFVFCGLVPWTFFALALSTATTSVSDNEPLVTKVYLPRMALPLSVLLAGGVDFLLASAVLVVLMLGYGEVPGAAILAVLPLSALMGCASLGIALWLSALNVHFRDVRHAMPFLTQLFFYATPIFYGVTLVPDHLRGVYRLNPMVGIVEGFRWAWLGLPADSAALLTSAIIAAILLGTGLVFFRRTEHSFADVV